MTENEAIEFGRLAGQVQGLEMVLKSVVAFQLSSMVKDEAGFSRMADLARELSQRLQAQVTSISEDAERRGIIAPATIASMRETVARCYDQPAEQMEQIARIVLELSETPSDATH